jgi:hypothetical protein
VILTDADELRATLALVMRERDEARADLHSLQGAHETLRQAIYERNAAILDRDMARAEVERMRGALLVALEMNRLAKKLTEDAFCTIAERQREACAAYLWAGYPSIVHAERIRATPLVTEVES